MNPEQAWQSVLGQLKLEMPRASFDSWVRNTQFISFENNLMTVAARTQYARDWLENRLSSTVSRLLTGMLNHSVDVEFVVSPDEPDESDEPEQPGKAEPREDEAEVQVVNRLNYDEIVSPSRVVAIPGYFSRLIPDIGARNAWLYVGWRQAVWNGERGNQGGSRSRRIPVSHITRYSGLGRRTFFRATDDPATWQALEGLVERQDITPHWIQGQDRRSHRLPNKYTVHMTLPLSQADSRAIMVWLKEQLVSGKSLFEVLKQAAGVKDLVGELLPLIGSVSTRESPRFETVMDIATHLNQARFAKQIAVWTSDLQTAAEKLHRKVISGFGTILITHYFLEQVIPQTGLTPPQAWLVTLLRDRCFTNIQTGEVRDEVLVRGGYPELANWLGIARPKTIWEWIRDGKGAVGAFIAVQPLHAGDEPDALRLKVRLDEPLFDGASDTIGMAQMSLADGGDDTINLAQMTPLDGAVDTDEWRKWHSIKLLNTDSSTYKTHSTTSLESVAVPDNWNLQKLLVQNNAHSRVTKELLAKNVPVQRFLSWILFACSSAGKNISSPISFAISSLRLDESRGAGKNYELLATLSPAELIELIRRSCNPFGSFSSAGSNNTKLWEKTMGHSGNHEILLKILIGE
jgi:hypothetical protein